MPRVAVLVLACWVPHWLPAASSTTVETLRVALISEFSGALAGRGATHIEPFRDFVVPFINAKGGIPLGNETWRIEVVEYDTASDPANTVPGIMAAVAAGEDLAGNEVGEVHAIMAGTAVSNGPIKAEAQALGILNLHSSGGNPTAWKASDTFAFGMHLPFTTYTRGPIRLAKLRGLNTIAIIRSWAHGFSRASCIAALEWAKTAGLRVIGPSVEWCDAHQHMTGQCRVVGTGDRRRCICGEQADVDSFGYKYNIENESTFYELDENLIGNGAVDGVIDSETTAFARSMFQDMRARGEMPDIVLNFAFEHHNVQNAMWLEDFSPKLLFGWQGRTGLDWAVDSENVLSVTHGIGAVGFGQWHPAMRFADPLFGSNAECVRAYADAYGGALLDYARAGAIATGVVLYKALSSYVSTTFKSMTLSEKRDALRLGVGQLNDETMWGLVRFNRNNQNNGRDVAVWQIMPNSQGGVEQLCILPAEAAEAEMYIPFPSWDARFGCPAGTENHFHTCVDCPAGRFNSNSTPGLTQTRCEICSLGVGTAADSVGAKECIQCPLGTSHVDGSGICAPCPRGTFRSTDALGAPESCSLCESGRFSNSTGLSQCHACPWRTIQPDMGQEFCLCDETSFRDPSEKLRVGSVMPCLACDSVLPGSRSSRVGAASAAECLCMESYRLDAAAGCVSCGEGLLCTGGTEAPWQQEGHWASLSWQASTAVDSTAGGIEASAAGGGWHVTDGVLRCRNAWECPGGATGTCAAGRTGRACARCQDAHTPAADGTCLPCSGTDGLLPAFVLLALVSCGILGSLFLNVDPSSASIAIVTITAAAGQLLWAFQALSALSMMEFNFPEPFSSLLALSHFLAFDLHAINIACLFKSDDPVLMFTFALLAYPAMLSVLGLLVLIRRMAGAPSSIVRIMNFNGIVVSTFFLALTTYVLQPFLCRSNPNGTSSMKADPSITCFGDSSVHVRLAGLSIVGILCYPVLFFTVCCWATCSYRGWMISERGLDFFVCFSFLFGRYRKEWYWCGVMYMLRNMAIALIPVVLVSMEWLQAPAMCALLLLSSQGAPNALRSGHANRSEQVLCSGLVVILVAAGPTATLSTASKVHGLGSIMLILMVSLLLVVISAACYGVWQRARPNTYDAFLCHHKAGAGSFARFVKIGMRASLGMHVFLDSDDLMDLDALFDIVRTRTKVLVVLLTPEVLKRPWCAGEIVIAGRNKVRRLPLICDGTPFPNRDESAMFIDAWATEQVEMLKSFHISGTHIVDAFDDIRLLPSEAFDRFAAPSDQLDCISAVGQLCIARGVSSMTTSHGASDMKDARVAIIGASDEYEPLAVCHILQALMRRELRVHIVVLRTPSEADSVAASISTGVVVLSAGVLFKSCFAAVMLALSNGDTHQGSLNFALVQADSAFEYPNEVSLLRVQSVGNLICNGAGLRLANLCRRLFRFIAMPLAPLGAETLIQAQVENICKGLRTNTSILTLEDVHQDASSESQTLTDYSI